MTTVDTSDWTGPGRRALSGIHTHTHTHQTRWDMKFRVPRTLLASPQKFLFRAHSKNRPQTFSSLSDAFHRDIPELTRTTHSSTAQNKTPMAPKTFAITGSNGFIAAHRTRHRTSSYPAPRPHPAPRHRAAAASATCARKSAPTFLTYPMHV